MQLDGIDHVPDAQESLGRTEGGERKGRIQIAEAGFENADNAETRPLPQLQPKRGQLFSLRTDYVHYASQHHAGFLRHARTEDNAGESAGGLHLFKRTLLQMFQHVRGIVDWNALQFGVSNRAATERTSQQHRAVKIGSDADNVRKPAELGIEFAPVVDSLARVLS